MKHARSVLRWVPAVLLLVAIGLSWGLVWNGGILGITAYYLLLQLTLPILGVIVGIVLIIYGAIKKRISAPMIASAVLLPLMIWPGLWLLGVLTIPYPTDRAKLTPEVSVRLPTDAPMQVIWGGPRKAANRHTVLPDQIWAYDLAVEPLLTGSSELTDYGCYGVEVVAPIEGLVAVAHDGEPDATPGLLVPNYTAPYGNYVVLELETGTYLIIAHLQEDSVVVEEGQRVQEGDLLGRCGNSGNTSEPHVHIHHQRQDPREWPANFAEGLPLYFERHTGDMRMPEGGIRIEGQEIIPLGAILQHTPED